MTRISLPKLTPVPLADLFACVEHEGEDHVLMTCPMLADGTPDTDNYGPADREACELSTLEAIDDALGTFFSEPKPEPKEMREINGHHCYGRVVEIEARTEDVARLLAARSKGGGYTWEAKEGAW